MKNLIKKISLKVYKTVVGKHPQNTIFSYNWLYVRNILKWYKKYQNIFNEKVIADYGAGRCPYHNFCHKAKKYYALDFYNEITCSPKLVEKICLNADGSIPDSFSEKVDVVISNQVLPEIDDPIKYFKQIAKISKVGSKLFLTTSFVQPLGLNDKFRLSPYYLNLILEKNGFEITTYQESGFFFTGMAFSLTMLLVMKNKYDFRTSEVKLSIYRSLIFAPFIISLNFLSFVLDKIIKLRRFPAHYLVIAQKINNVQV